MKLQKMTLMLIVLFAATTLGACSKIPEREKIEITLMHGYGGSSPDHVNMRKIYEDFELAHPEIKLIFDASPDLPVVIDKANDKLAADKMPDIISTNGESRFLTNAIIKGKALNLKPYIDADEQFKNDIHPSILKAWMKNDTIYTIPNVLEIAGYWYNESILRAAGVTEDATMNSKVKLPTTWDEFWEACNKIAEWSEWNNNDIKPLIMENDQSLLFLGARIAGENESGTELMNGDTVDFNTPEFRTAIDDLRKAYTYSEHTLNSRNDIVELFKDGKLAFFISGVWDSNDFSASINQDQMKYAAFPAYDGKMVSYVSPSSGYVIGNTGDPVKIEACVTFLKYLLSYDVQKRMVEETNQAPSNPHVDLEWIKQVTPMLGMALKVAHEADIHIWTLDSLRDGQAIDILKHNLDRLINNSLTYMELSEMLNR